MYEWYERHNEGGGNLPTEPFTKFGPRTVRWAKCEANSKCETYPERPANKFPISFGELTWDDTTCGCEVPVWVPYDPAEDRIALDNNDNYHVEGKIVLIFLSHDKWYIASPPVVNAEAILAEDMCRDDMEPVVSDFRELPDCDLVDPPPLIKNPNRHSGPAGSKLKLVKKKCERGEDCIGSTEWHVVDIELQDYCATVGLDSREWCLVAAGLKLGGEFCPADIPVTACVVVTYTDCEIPPEVCDQSWVFDPLYACCGQAGTPETQSMTESSGSGPSSRGPSRGPGGRIIKRKFQ